MQDIYRALARLMQTDLTVMITGESGTGKELVARALHDFGKRRNGPFVAINMAAIPRDLIEAELFGHEKGAFTGATARSSGRFEQAEGGTLFLDEIGDMPMDAQTRLLRVLQEGEYTMVGGRTPIKSNVRIVAATHRDLSQMIRQGLFREDLYYRLNVVPIRLPPLRERVDDIGDLVQHFLRAAQREGEPVKTISPDAIRLMQNYSWPGNVRELENLVRRLSALYADENISLEIVQTELNIADRQPVPAADRAGGRVDGGRDACGAIAARARAEAAARRALSARARQGRGAADRHGAQCLWRQPDQGGGTARPQPQHAAQEDPGALDRDRQAVAAARARAPPCDSTLLRRSGKESRAARRLRQCHILATIVLKGWPDSGSDSGCAAAESRTPVADDMDDTLTASIRRRLRLRHVTAAAFFGDRSKQALRTTRPDRRARCRWPCRRPRS